MFTKWQDACRRVDVGVLSSMIDVADFALVVFSASVASVILAINRMRSSNYVSQLRKNYDRLVARLSNGNLQCAYRSVVREQSTEITGFRDLIATPKDKGNI